MAVEGFCAIKEQYIVKKADNSNLKRPHHAETGEMKIELPDDSKPSEEPLLKKLKDEEYVHKENGNGNKPTSNENIKAKFRGQNKSRPKPLRDAPELCPCPTIINVHQNTERENCRFKSCRYIHDSIEYLKNKPCDVLENEEGCYVYKIKGECPWGISCRFGSKHITMDGFNLIDNEKLSKWTNSTLNLINNEVLFKLQKRKYDFTTIERFVNCMKSKKESKKQDSDKLIESSQIFNEKSNLTIDRDTLSGVVTDEDIIRTRSSEKTRIDWKDKLYLGPLTTLGNLPFRRICKEFGADVTCGEMVMCDSLLKGTKQEWALVKRHNSEDLFGIQICGTNPYIISKVCDIVNKEDIKVDFVDLNLGCPIDLVYKKGGGCGMLVRPNVLETSIKCASNILTVPFTIKTRTGVQQDVKITHQLAPKFFEWGASMLTIHGRSREQRYTKFSDWDYINECAKLSQPNPVFGNGDILSYEDYVKSREKAPFVSGTMICRGGLIKPWIFTEIKEKKLWDISSNERFDILKKYVNYGLEHWGSDSRGVENTRRFLLEWCSFLYRYVPVGILEKPPQRINERPPYYFGRNDLETLMASPNCTDWIKLSEMLLGNTPEGFKFLPKHKANSYT